MKTFKLVKEVINESIASAKFTAKYVIKKLPEILNLTLPYAMYFLGQKLMADRNEYIFGGELFIPILVILIVSFLRSLADKMNVGNRVPVPDKRFTEVGDDGEVTIIQDRIQELILYVADLEDYLEKKNYFNK